MLKFSVNTANTLIFSLRTYNGLEIIATGTNSQVELTEWVLISAIGKWSNREYTVSLYSNTSVDTTDT